MCAYVSPYLPSWRVIVYFPVIVPILSLVGLLPLGTAFGICKWMASKLDDSVRKIEFVMLLISSILGSVYYVIRLIDFLHKCQEINPYKDIEELSAIEWIMCVFMVGYLIIGAVYVARNKD
jgi:hypothetical protein